MAAMTGQNEGSLFATVLNSIGRRDGGGNKQGRLVGVVPALVMRVGKEIPIP